MLTWSGSSWSSQSSLGYTSATVEVESTFSTVIEKITSVPLLWKYPIFLQNPGGFQWSVLAWGDLEPSYACVNFYVSQLLIFVFLCLLSNVLHFNCCSCIFDAFPRPTLMSLIVCTVQLMYSDQGNIMMTTGLSPTPLPGAIHARSHQLPFNSCWNIRVAYSTTFTSSVVTLNSPVYSQPWYWPQIISLHSSLHLGPWWLLHVITMWRYLYCVFIYIYFLMIEKYLCECRNVWIKYLCSLLVYMCFHLHFSSELCLITPVFELFVRFSSICCTFST